MFINEVVKFSLKPFISLLIALRTKACCTLSIKFTSTQLKSNLEETKENQLSNNQELEAAREERLRANYHNLLCWRRFTDRCAPLLVLINDFILGVDLSEQRIFTKHFLLLLICQGFKLVSDVTMRSCVLYTFCLFIDDIIVLHSI